MSILLKSYQNYELPVSYDTINWHKTFSKTASYLNSRLAKCTTYPAKSSVKKRMEWDINGMADIVMVVNETVGITETVTVVLSPELCRNCGGKLQPTADFKCCNECSVYYVGKRYL